jgi:flavodoxin
MLAQIRVDNRGNRMKVLVAYMSSTGNTKKVAEAIFNEISGEKELKRIEDVQDIGSYDISFLGFPTHQFGPDKKTKEFLQKHCTAGRNVALFVTHCAPEDVAEVPEWMAKFKQAAAGANLVGFFDCQGELAKSVETIMKLAPKKEIRFFAKNHKSQGQPDEARLMKARAFARDMMNRMG